MAQKSDEFDGAGIERDRNLAFPLDRIRELAAEAIIGEVAEALQLHGIHHDAGPSDPSDAQEVARRLVEDRVDALLLTPV